MRQHLLLLSVLSLALVAHTAWAGVFDPRFSHAPHYTGSRLYQTGVGFDSVGGMVGSYGDFNSDKYTDAIVISQNRSDVFIYLWNTNTYHFEKSQATVHFDFSYIASVSAADFNKDGKLDLLIQAHPYNMSVQPPVPITGTTQLWICLGDWEKFSDQTNFILENAYNGQVAIFEWNGDLLPDLLGNRPSQTNPSLMVKTVWKNSGDGKTYTLVPFTDDPQSQVALADPHSVAMVDFNGDCMPDLWIDNVDGSSEIWLNQNDKYVKSSLTLATAAAKVAGRGQITFADYDADGAVDLLFPVCYPVADCSQVNEIRIIYNVQRPICAGIFSKNCRESGKLCTADDSFSFAPLTTNTPSADVTIIRNTSFPTGNNNAPSRLFASTTTGVPLTIRAGDFNVDRYVDLLVPILMTDTLLSQVSLWKNVPCYDGGGCGADSRRRTFQVQTGDSVSAMTSLNGGFGGSWFDLDEDGNLDIILTLETTNSLNQRVLSLAAITNNFFNDGYFVKTLGLNGLCTVNCGIQDIKLGRKPYGVNQHGGVWKYTLTDLSGTQLVNAVPQLPQSAYSALQTPYVLSGLGRPSNYIDYVYFGAAVFNTGKGNFQSWPGIIPNSQVVVTPYPLNNPANWAIELYISPSGALIWIAIAVVVCLLISGGGILFFQWREKKADEAEKKEREHLFSFNAM